MPSLSIIGAGNVGITLGRLFHRQGYEIGAVCNRSLQSAQRAAVAIGAGQAVARLSDVKNSDFLLVATSDNALGTIAVDLLDAGVPVDGSIAFHCSGATPSSVLARLRDRGAAIAGVHPVKSFTAPAQDADSFPGTWCGIEGDPAATGKLSEIFTAFGGKVFPVDGDSKVLYHTAIVFICNYVFPLIEAGLVCYEKAGVPRELAAEIVRPILHATIDNALRLGPGKALTGPIARGDDSVVGNQVKALAAFDPELRVLYEAVGSYATHLALEKGVATPEGIEAIRRLLSYDHYRGTA